MIRAARVDDAAALADINLRGWEFAYAGYVPLETMRSAAGDIEGTWRAGLSRPDDPRRTWVSERDGRVVGFVTVGASRDADAAAGLGELMAIYLAPEAVGSGVGSALIRHGERALAELGFAEATLWVFEANARARRFYERHGWIVEPGSGPGPYGWAPSLRYRKAVG